MVIYATIYGSLLEAKINTCIHDEEENPSSIYNNWRPLSFYTEASHERVSSFMLEGNNYHQPLPPHRGGGVHRDKFALIWKTKVLLKTANREKESIQNTKQIQKKYSECYVLPHVTGRLNEHRTYINLFQLFWKNKKMLQKQRVKLFAKTKP